MENKRDQLKELEGSLCDQLKELEDLASRARPTEARRHEMGMDFADVNIHRDKM